MPDKFVMRGQTESGSTEVLNFSGYKPGYAYRLVEFKLWPSASGSTGPDLTGSITAGKTGVSPVAQNFNDEGLIGSASFFRHSSQDSTQVDSIVNDTFLITQNLILMVQNEASGGEPINWQCRFVAEKMTGPQEAVANYKQFQISDG